MDTLVKSLAALVTPEIAGRIAKFAGADAARVGQVARILTGLALASLAKRSVTPEGAAAAFHALPQDDEPGLLASLVAVVKGDLPAATEADRLQALFGGGVNSMVAALSQKSGFDAGPLAGMLAPLIGQEIAKAARGLETEGFAALVKQAYQELSDDPAGAEVAAVVDETMTIGAMAEAVRARFTAEELEEIHTAPMAAYYLVAKSSLSGIRGSFAEVKAAHQAGTELLKDVAPTSLLGCVFGAGLTTSEAAELKREAEGDDPLLATIRSAAAVVKAKSPEELDTFRALVAGVAESVAAAAKEGGLFGIGGTRVTDKEQAAIDRIRAALE